MTSFVTRITTSICPLMENKMLRDRGIKWLGSSKNMKLKDNFYHL